MKNLDDAYTIGDVFINDKSTEDEPDKLNMESEVVSMVTVLIHQASSSVPPLFTPVIDLSSPSKHVSSATQAPIFTATTTTTTTTLSPPPQQSSIDSEVFTLELRDLPHKIDEAVQDTDSVHLPKIKQRPEWLKPIPEEDRPETLKPDWSIPPNDLPEPENNWANALTNSYKDPEENKLLRKIGDIGSFITWFCKRIWKKKLSKSDLEGPAYKANNIVIRKHVEDLQLGIESYQTKLNLTQPDWDASDFLFKEDYTIVSKPRALDHMVKDFKLYEYNKGMETRIWSEDDRRRSKDFIEVIERRLKIWRIFSSLESFVGGRLRDVDYKLIQRIE
ncbi:hypothetical protein Tco_0746755 [Tanacetum coccineum]